MVREVRWRSGDGTDAPAAASGSAKRDLGNVLQHPDDYGVSRPSKDKAQESSEDANTVQEYLGVVYGITIPPGQYQTIEKVFEQALKQKPELKDQILKQHPHLKDLFNEKSVL